MAVATEDFCVTSHVEDDRATVTGLGSSESVVIMAKSYHQGNQTESDYVNCIESSLRSGSQGINVVPRQQFVDRLFPWFEPRTVPADTKGLPGLMDRPGVKQAIADMGVRYVVWLDGDTERACYFSMTGGQGTVALWAWHAASELGVHRLDVEDALDHPHSQTDDQAIDAITYTSRYFLPAMRRVTGVDPGKVDIELRTSTGDTATVTIDSDLPASVSITGPPTQCALPGLK